MENRRTIVKAMDISFNASTLSGSLNELKHCIRATLMDLVEFQNTGRLPDPEENQNFKKPADFLSKLEKVQNIFDEYLDSFYHCSNAMERSKYGADPALVVGLKMDANQCQQKTKAYMLAMAS